jgi:hypothetical protein
MQTEVQLLELLIKAEAKTKAAFADMIGMSRQNINYHIREANQNNGKLSDEFKHKLKDYNLDLYRFKRNPTNDFVTQSEPSGVVAEPIASYTMDQKIIDLYEKQIKLMEELNDCKRERDFLKSQLEDAGLAPKKSSRRHSA